MSQAVLANGVTLEYEIHGDRAHPVILVILGITDNITDWPSGLYETWVSAGYCVVLFELRDSGLSTKFEEAGWPDLAGAKQILESGSLPPAPYTAADTAEDARLLLEHLGIKSAHVVGYSFGAFLAQLLTLSAPDIVTALICLQGSSYNPDLPPRTPAVDAAMIGAAKDYPTREEKIAAMMGLRLAANGSIHAMDGQEARESAETSVDRIHYPQGTARMILSRFAIAPVFDRLGDIKCPALVLHADEDPIFSSEHGEELAALLPDARLSVLKGAGHNHPLSLQPIIAERILGFVSQLSRS